MARRTGKPAIEDAQRWVSNDVPTWEPRDSRFQREQNVFFLKPPSTPLPGEEMVIPNDPAFITEKASRILGNLEQRIEITPRDPAQTERAQIIENLLRGLREQFQRRWATGLHHPLDYEIGKYLIQRGWVCSRILLNTDDSSPEPILHTIWDPANVYPYEVNGELVRVTHRYNAKVSDLIDDDALPESEEVFSTLTGMASRQVIVYSIYAKYRGDYWHMVYTGGATAGEWLKKPTKIGYMPWIISMAIGVPWRSTEFDDYDYISHIGESFFTNQMGMYKQQQKMMTMLATIIATMANPPTALFLDEGGKIVESQISLKPGTRMIFPKGRIEQFRLGAGLSDIISYWQMLQDRENKATFTGVSFGDGTNVQSGYMGESLKAGNSDVLYPYVQCLSTHWQQVYERSLDIIKKFWPSQMDVFVAQNSRRTGKWAKASATDIIAENPFVRVKYKTASLAERLQLGNLAAGLVRDHLITLETARGSQFVDLDDPNFEEEGVQADLIKTDPKMIQAMVPLALMFTGRKMQSELFNVFHGQEIQQALMMGLQGPQPQGVPGQQAPGAAGVPGQALPPAMAQGQTPVDPQQAQLAMLINTMMGAQGGMGMGGVPPQNV